MWCKDITCMSDYILSTYTERGIMTAREVAADAKKLYRALLMDLNTASLRLSIQVRRTVVTVPCRVC